MQDFASAQYLKHRVLGIAYLIYLPYLCSLLFVANDYGKHFEIKFSARFWKPNPYLAFVSFVGNHIDSCHPACFVIHQWLELAVDGFFHHPFYRLNGISMLYGQTLRCLFIQRRW
jgi:hypothetical protein